MVGIIYNQFLHLITASQAAITSCTLRKDTRVLYTPSTMPFFLRLRFSHYAFVFLCMKARLKGAWWKKCKDFAGNVLEALVVGKMED